jgi:hypothetical protein
MKKVLFRPCWYEVQAMSEGYQPTGFCEQEIRRAKHEVKKTKYENRIEEKRQVLFRTLLVALHRACLHTNRGEVFK